MKLSIKRRSIVMTWLISYLSVLLVPVLIGGSIYWEALRIVGNEINRSNEAPLIQIKETADNRLRDLDTLGYQVSMNQRVLDFINAGEQLTDDDHYQILNIAKDLSVYKLANQYIDQVYVYYKNSDLVLSDQGWVKSKSLYEQYRPGKDTGFEEWKAFYNQKYVKGYFPVVKVSSAEPSSSIMYARSAVLQNPDMPGAMILFLFDGNKSLENLHDIPLNDNSYVMVVDRQNRLIASTNPSVRTPIISYDALPGLAGNQHEKMSGEDISFSYTTSPITGWKYVSVTPDQVYFEKLQYLRELTYACIALILVIGGLITFYSLKRNYNPVHSLILSLSQKTGMSFENKINEFQFIQEAVNDTVKEKEKIGLRLKQHRSTIRNGFLVRSLKGRIGAGIPVHESLAAHEIEFPEPDFAVVLFHIENLGKLVADDELGKADNTRLVHFVLSNVAEELAHRHYPAYVAETDDMLAFIVNCRQVEERAGSRESRRDSTTSWSKPKRSCGRKSA
ncbi:cache domain-containing protein [Paenibacillus sp. P25]|nr:cache domain-containing protein [Paenibacillus sp. P25]